MATVFKPAPEVKKIAEELIPLYHPHLVDARVDYIFCNNVPKKGGKEVWGTMRKITNLNAYLGADKNSQENGVNDPFFVMTISEPVWDELDDKAKKALVDHELCHGWVELDEDGDAKLGILPHDLEEFNCIVERHGLWRPDIKRFMKTKPVVEEEEDEEE